LVIKLLRLLGKFLLFLFRIIAGFFRFIFGGVIYKLLVKIYYEIFRFKRTHLSDKTWPDFLRGKSLYVFIVTLAIILFISNLATRNQTAAAETQIPKTVLAGLITNEFGDAGPASLIEENLTPGSIMTAGKEKYVDDSCSLTKSTGLILEENLETNQYLVFNDEGDMILKPRAAILGGPGGQTGQTSPVQRTAIVYYTVQPGDTVSIIAREFSITINTILWANSLSARSLIQPGDRLTILPYSGVLYTVRSGDTLARIAQKYSVDSDKILSCNDLAAGLKAGQKIIIPGGKQITQTAVASRPAQSGLNVIGNLIKSSPTKSVAGKMLWPTVSHNISQYYSWRHTAVDLPNKLGSPVFAADSGTVIYAGWSTGYGYNVVIDHGGGIKTRYGHSSKLLVSVGDEVEKGQTIMLVGSTGWSTGPHVHFEVMVNGAKYNPLNYIR